ncbi:MAG: sulfatase [Chitinophagaceae bacterium]
MKSFFLNILLLLAMGSFAQQRPNIVLIVSDDHAFQAIGAYGSKLMATPAIDRIAKEGIRFDRACVTNSICGPSRAVILTGKYSHLNGFKDNDHSRFNGAQNSFIKELTSVGYQTAWIGKWHLETKPQGFSYWQILPGQGSYYNPDFIMMDSSKKRINGYVTNVIEDLAEDWLSNRDTTKPFCLVIGHKATHRNWMPDTTDLGRFDKVQFPLPANFYDDYAGRPAAALQDMTVAKTMTLPSDLKMYENEDAAVKDGEFKRMNAVQRTKFMAYYLPIQQQLKTLNPGGNALTEWKYQRYMRDYLSTAAALDRNINRTLDYLDKHQLAKSTIVIYESDQGFYLGEHGWFDKRWMYEESLRTPMVMRYPGVIKPGSVNNDLVLNLDIAPTILNVAGVAVPKDMQGSSFLPLINGKKAKSRDAMYYHYYENGTHSVSPQFGVATQRYKLIRYYEKVTGWELFDLQSDAHEMKNVYGQKGYEKITETLKKRLNELIELYGDEEAKTILSGEQN